MNEKKSRKRLNHPETKAKIIAAAQEVFAEKGYSGAGTRDIAAAAGVSAALLQRYFGSKAGIFEAVLNNLIPEDLDFSKIDRSRFGDTVVRLILDPDRELKAPSIIALAIGDAETKQATVHSAENFLIPPLAEWLGPPQAEARALEIVMVAFGFMIFGRRLGVMPHLVGVKKDTGKWLAKTLQEIVDRTK